MLGSGKLVGSVGWNFILLDNPAAGYDVNMCWISVFMTWTTRSERWTDAHADIKEAGVSIQPFPHDLQSRHVIKMINNYHYWLKWNAFLLWYIFQLAAVHLSVAGRENYIAAICSRPPASAEGNSHWRQCTEEGRGEPKSWFHRAT